MSTSGPHNPFVSIPTGEAPGALPFGVTSPFYELDDLTGGFLLGSLYVVIGRKGMGHQTLALNVVGNHHRTEKRPVLLLTMGQKRGPLEMGIACSLLHVWIKSGAATMDDDAAYKRLLKANVDIDYDELVLFDEQQYMSSTELREEVSAQAINKGIALVVIRDLQKVQAACWNRNYGDVYCEFASDDEHERAQAALSQELKDMARELGIPVLCTLDVRKGSLPPTIDDLASFGYLENNADMVLSLHRDEVHDPYTEKWGIADLRIVKYRFGPLAHVQLAYLKGNRHFENLAASPMW
jgi:replicative DNA helicase